MEIPPHMADDLAGLDEPAALPQLPVTWRPTRTRVVAYAVAVAIVITMSVIAAILPHDGANPWHTGDRIAFAAIGLFVAAALHLLARPRVIADAGGLTVVNMVRTHHLDWAQIVRVNLRTGDPWVLLDLDNGEVLPAMGIQSSGGLPALRAVAQLRDLVDAFTLTERDD